MTNPAASALQFGDIRLEPRNFKISKAGVPISLEPKTFLLLVFLVENRGRLVEKKEILDAVWKDTAVTENALTREIGKLRKSLADDPKAAKYIQTVHTRGYRFIANVEVVESSQPHATPPPDDTHHATVEIPPPQLNIESTALYQGSRFQKVFAVAIILGVLVTTPFFFRKAPAPAKTNPLRSGVISLAILPFHPLAGDDNNQYMGIGVADALITKLSNSDRLAVQPMSTVLHYMDPKEDSLAIGRAMGVDYVLEGKFQTRGDHTRFSVQLLCVACAGPSRWAATFDESSQDVFQVQDSISAKVVTALTVKLTGDQQKRLEKRDTSQPNAQLAFAKGQHFLMQDTKEGVVHSIQYLELAVNRDPNYAGAWAVLSDSYRRQGWHGGSPAEFLPKTREAVDKALQLDDSSAYAHSMAGLIAFEYDWDFAKAESEYKRALQINPHWIHQWYARYLLTENRVSDAESEYRRFAKMMPFSVSGNTHYAEFLFLTGQYDRATSELSKTLELDANYPPAHELLGLVYEQQNLAEKAEEEFKKASGLSNGLSGLGALGHLYATSHRLRHTQDVLDDMREHAKQRYVSPYEFAVIHAGLGYSRRALAELDQAYTEHSLPAQSLRFDPRLNNLRSEARYHEFAKRLGLE